MIWKYGLRFLSSWMDSVGFVLIPKWRLTMLMHGTLLRALFRERGVDCVLDVGANRGQFRDFLREEVGYKGLILSFEPIHHLAALCASRASNDPDWHVIEIALGDKDTRASINVAKSDDMSSFLMPRNDIAFIAGSATVSIETVEMKTLDSVFDTLRSKYKFHNSFLKLDTQGFDLSVIRGAETTLKSICAMQTELSVIPIYNGMPTWLEVIVALREYGFEMSRLYDVSRDTDFRAVEFDGVFVRAPIASDAGGAEGSPVPLSSSRSKTCGT
jgi:FkbM family methyltransferase